MYQVSFCQTYKRIVVDSPANECPEGYPVAIICADLERALALASLLQKISTPEVLNNQFFVNEVKFKDHETEKK